MSTPRPPALRLTKRTARSYKCNDLDALRAALLELGADPAAPANNEAWRLWLGPSLALGYKSGRIVAAGHDPAPLLAQLEAWAAETPATPRRDPQAGAHLFEMFGEPSRKGVR
jgi:hypothetical protein